MDAREKEFKEFKEQARREGFAVNINESRYRPGEKSLNITHNGYQWTTASLTIDEMRAVVKCMNEHLEEED